MGIRSLSTASIANGVKRSKFWDTNARFTSFESIASTVLTASTSSITFSSIPTGFTHLQIRGVIRGTVSGNQQTAALRMNGASATGSYRTHCVISKNSTPSSYETGPTTMIEFYEAPGASQASGIFGAAIIDILDYGNTNKHKVAKITYGFDNANANSSNTISIFTGVYKSTDVINSVSLIEQSGTNSYAAGTTWSLYGIKGA